MWSLAVNDYRKVNKIEPSMVRAKGRRHHRGKFCPCCCARGGDPQFERRLVARARRRLDKAVIAVEMADVMG
jgi:hypothetical protein